MCPQHKATFELEPLPCPGDTRGTACVQAWSRDIQLSPALSPISRGQTLFPVRALGPQICGRFTYALMVLPTVLASATHTCPVPEKQRVSHRETEIGRDRDTETESRKEGSGVQ